MPMPARVRYDLAMSLAGPSVSVVIPTYREVENIEPLVARLHRGLIDAEITGEIIIVDDNSADGTDELVARLTSRYPIRLLVRRDERGLATAVLAGFAMATGSRFVVMDADLQHPPESVPELLARLERGDCDFVCATRYAAGGSVGQRWPFRRRFASRMAALLARPLSPMSDPMSGFFALRREVWERAAPLDPVGYKIGLELFVKGRCRACGEVPIQFGERHAGATKFGPREVARYLRHLGRLYRWRFPVATIVAGIGGLAVVAGLVYLAWAFWWQGGKELVQP